MTLLPTTEDDDDDDDDDKGEDDNNDDGDGGRERANSLVAPKAHKVSHTLDDEVPLKNG